MPRSDSQEWYGITATFHVSLIYEIMVMSNHSHFAKFSALLVTFTLPSRTPVIIMLSKLDDRYARGLLDRMRFSLDFQVYKKEGVEPIVASNHSIFNLRSVNAEADLEAGEYVVHVRVDSEIIRGAVRRLFWVWVWVCGDSSPLISPGILGSEHPKMEYA